MLLLVRCNISGGVWIRGITSSRNIHIARICCNMTDKILGAVAAIFVAVLGFFAIKILSHDNNISLIEQSIRFIERDVARGHIVFRGYF